MHVKIQPQIEELAKFVIILTVFLLARCRFWGSFFCYGQNDVKYEKQHAGDAKKICKFILHLF